jgi:tRNA nucleotidyltransferase/poly(A) polymerase
VESPQMAENKSKTERISKMKAKALRSGDPSEIGKWLTESGALDHLY